MSTDEMVWQLTTTRQGERTTLHAIGELDLDSAPVLSAAILRLIDEGARTVVVSLAEVTFVDSSGLGALVAVWRRARQAGVELSLLDPSDDVRMTLDITGLDRILPIAQS